MVVGKLSKTKAQLTKDIEALGGLVVSKPDAKTATCISAKGRTDVLLYSPHYKLLLHIRNHFSCCVLFGGNGRQK